MDDSRSVLPTQIGGSSFSESREAVIFPFDILYLEVLGIEPEPFLSALHALSH